MANGGGWTCETGAGDIPQGVETFAVWFVKPISAADIHALRRMGDDPLSDEGK